MKPVQPSAPPPLRTRSIGSPSPAALESLAAYLLARILAKRVDTPRRPVLALVPCRPQLTSQADASTGSSSNDS